MVVISFLFLDLLILYVFLTLPVICAILTLRLTLPTLKRHHDHHQGPNKRVEIAPRPPIPKHLLILPMRLLQPRLQVLEQPLLVARARALDRLLDLDERVLERDCGADPLDLPDGELAQAAQLVPARRAVGEERAFVFAGRVEGAEDLVFAGGEVVDEGVCDLRVCVLEVQVDVGGGRGVGWRGWIGLQEGIEFGVAREEGRVDGPSLGRVAEG